ncbi:MAG: hypothetical protein IKN72_07745 [Clostridia bacterium]|nr:hypothetical protein [Clostridia bacterium]
MEQPLFVWSALLAGKPPPGWRRLRRRSVQAGKGSGEILMMLSERRSPAKPGCAPAAARPVRSAHGAFCSKDPIHSNFTSMCRKRNSGSV